MAEKNHLSPDRPGEPRKSSADISKIKKELKWHPLFKFDDTIKSMIKEIHEWKDAPLWTPKKLKKQQKPGSAILQIQNEKFANNKYFKKIIDIQKLKKFWAIDLEKVK